MELICEIEQQRNVQSSRENYQILEALSQAEKSL
jgi:hypothetical protein